MHLSRLGRAELIAALGGLLLAVGVFTPWAAALAPLILAWIIAGGALRASGAERPRKPPGVL